MNPSWSAPPAAAASSAAGPPHPPHRPAPLRSGGCHAGPTGQGRVSTSYNKQRGGHHQHRSRTVQTVQFTH